MALQHEIDEKSKEIFTENYAVSIGEILNMYRDGDIDIHPEFQRFYRWTNYQKSKLVESVLLNIPIPPIFVAQNQNGVWDVVDGLQRLSTVFEFAGILKDEEGSSIPPLKLEKTKLLPSLERKTFEASAEDDENCFTDTQRRYFKRAKLSVIIVQKESDPLSKFELFQRLNTGGTSLTDQEIRNCLLIMANKDAYNLIKELSEYPPFFNSLELTDKNLNEQYDVELVVRFIVLRNANIDELKRLKDLGEFLDEKMIELASLPERLAEEATAFRQTFDLLQASTAENSFKRWDLDRSKFSGGFLVSAFEIVAIGIGRNPGRYADANEITGLVKNAWRIVRDENIRWPGYSAAGRLPKTVDLGQRIFQSWNCEHQKSFPTA